MDNERSRCVVASKQREWMKGYCLNFYVSGWSMVAVTGLMIVKLWSRCNFCNIRSSQDGGIFINWTNRRLDPDI